MVIIVIKKKEDSKAGNALDKVKERSEFAVKRPTRANCYAELREWRHSAMK